MALAIRIAEPSDDALAAQANVGDRAALEELFRRHRLIAYRVAYRLLGNNADALDAVQEAFVKTLAHVGDFQGRSTFKTWFLRIVSNAALDLGRSRGRRETLIVESRRRASTDAVEPAAPDRGLEIEDLRLQLRKALDQLPAAQRQTFILFAEGELSYAEVAEALGISVGTVMSRLFYARQKLRVLMDAWIKPK